MKLSKNFIFISVVVIIALSAFLRFYHLGQPAEQVFDEVYFPVFAHDYITHTDFFDAHPPLGKLIIAVGIKTLGNVPTGWRIMNALSGILLLFAIFGFTYELTKQWRIALLALLLLAIDPMALVESRIGLINIYLALFSVLGLWFFWRWWDKKEHALSDYSLALVFFAAAIAVKWIGAGALGAAGVYFLWKKLIVRDKNAPPIKPSNWIVLLILPIIYFASFIPDIRHGQDIWWWHANAFNYHAHLKATHPYGAAWWTWSIVGRPIWFYYKTLANGKTAGIIDIGNVFTWIGGLIALFSAFYLLAKKHVKKYKDQLLFLIITYLALYLRLIVISRVKFIYHYFVPVQLLLILLAIMLDQYVLSNKSYRGLGFLFLIVATIFFVFFLPLLMALPISQHYYEAHLWLKTWI